MIAKFFFILVAFNFSALAAASSISSEFLNSELKKIIHLLRGHSINPTLKLKLLQEKSFLIRLVSRLMC